MATADRVRENTPERRRVGQRCDRRDDQRAYDQRVGDDAAREPSDYTIGDHRPEVGILERGSSAAAERVLVDERRSRIPGDRGEGDQQRRDGHQPSIGNGLILGYLMLRSGLMPRKLARLGVIGGPLQTLAGTGVLFDLYPAGGAVQGIATIPEIIWELSLGIYPLVWGFKASPILEEEGRPDLHPSLNAR